MVIYRVQKLLFTFFLSLFLLWGQKKTTQTPKNLAYFHQLQKQQKRTRQPFSPKGSVALLQKSLQTNKKSAAFYPKPLDTFDIYAALSRVVYDEKGEGFLEEIQLPEGRDSLVAVLTPLLGAPEINENRDDDGTPFKNYIWNTQKGYMGFKYLLDDKNYHYRIFSTSAIDTTGGYFLSLAFDVPQMYIKAAMIVADYKLTTTILDPSFSRGPETGYYKKGGDMKEDWATYGWWMSVKGTPIDTQLFMETTERMVEGKKEEQIIRFIYGNL